LPEVPGSILVGCTEFMNGPTACIEKYRKTLGNAFRFKIAGKEFVVLCGSEVLTLSQRLLSFAKGYRSLQ
jgi:hypothetical protein